VADETSDTFTGVPLGTLRYMSPEQLRAGALSRSWDLWALAVIAYEALCGIHPFAAAEAAALPTAILDANVTPVTSYLPDAPPRLQDFFHQALAPQQGDRPASVTVFWSDLQSGLASV
jgi:serine/threonine protein kinase